VIVLFLRQDYLTLTAQLVCEFVALASSYHENEKTGVMRPSEALTNHRVELRQLVSRYGLSRPRVFGSVLRGTDTEDSDLDLLVDPADSTSLFTIAGLKIDAEKMLGVTVSVLTPNGLPPKFRSAVLKDAQPL